MNRRKVLQSLAATSLAMPLYPYARAHSQAESRQKRGSFALDGNHLRFFNTAIEKSFQITMLADTHLFTDDMRGEFYRPYSARMAKAYNETRHFRTGLPTNPEAGFREALAIAQDEQSELVALIGDIFSFPSEAGIEWALAQLQQAGLPYLYTAGNHDWHYEGLPGPHAALRATWCESRLKPLYQGENPLMGVREINGVRFVSIDNSTYEILPEQLAFFQAQAAYKQPMVLLLHIPLYAPGRTVGYGCGHPEWGAATDKNYEIERRERWPETGHTPTTFRFHREVFRSLHLMGILAGHIHKPTLDVIQGIPQVVTDANATGAYLKVEFVAEG
ncbi:MAG: metallophosphoesterase [Bacteroidia bacterium]